MSRGRAFSHMEHVFCTVASPVPFENAYPTDKYYLKQMLSAHVTSFDEHLTSSILHSCSGKEKRIFATNIFAFKLDLTNLVWQVVNMSPLSQNIAISLISTVNASIESVGKVITISSANPLDENSFELPNKVRTL